MSERKGQVGRGDGWRLQNVEELSQLHPRTFFIPPATERANLKPKDLVKLIFVLDEEAPNGMEAERMWVQVGGRDGDVYSGFLDNQPSLIKTLEPGDQVQFRSEHVAALQYDVAQLGYNPVLKVMVNRRVIQEDVFPGRAYKDVPTGVDDSGWTILVGGEAQDELQSKSTYISSVLGYLTDKFPRLNEVFRSDGGEWLWDPTQNRYVRQK